MKKKEHENCTIVIGNNYCSSFNHLRSMNITFCKCEISDMFIIHIRL